jgi:radical SAM protein with 4Fe4S-binding SPASM domain
LERWTPETFDHLWINQDKWPELDRVIERLIHLKSQGAPILNDENSLRLMLPYYREEPLNARNTCLTGLRNYFIRPNGDVQLCYYFPAVGNVKQQEAREIWWGEESKKVRKDTTKCSKNCLTACLYQRNIKEKVKQAVKLFVKK